MTINLDVDSRPNKAGLYRIYIRITENRKIVRKKTDVLIHDKSYFSYKAKHGKWISSRQYNYTELNNILHAAIEEYKNKNIKIQELQRELIDTKQSLENLNKSIIDCNTISTPYQDEQTGIAKKINALLSSVDSEYVLSFNIQSLEESLILTNKIEEFKTEYAFLKDCTEDLAQKTRHYHKNKTELFKYYAEEYKNRQIKLNKSPNFIRHISSQADTFLEFAGESIRLQDISTKTINDYIVYLSESNRKNNTIIDKVQRIGMILNAALSEQLIQINPVKFANFPEKSPIERHRLNDLQIQAIENLQIDYKENKYLFLAQKMFLFSFYNAGIRIGDCIQLRFSNIIDGRLEYQMGKTKLKKSILISRKSKEIIKEMSTLVPCQPINTIFGLLKSDAPYYHATDYESKKNLTYQVKKQMHGDMDSCATEIQDHLKKIAKLINHNKPLTFHISRHSFAEKARRAVKGGKATIFDIKSALGHQKIETTMRYLDSMDFDGLDKAMEAIFED